MFLFVRDIATRQNLTYFVALFTRKLRGVFKSVVVSHPGIKAISFQRPFVSAGDIIVSISLAAMFYVR